MLFSYWHVKFSGVKESRKRKGEDKSPPLGSTSPNEDAYNHSLKSRIVSGEIVETHHFGKLLKFNITQHRHIFF